MSGKSIDFLLNQMRSGVNGSLAGGSVTFYEAGTTTPKAVFLDYNLTLPTVAGILTPYTLSADGTAELFGYGLYRVVVKDSTSVIIYDYDNMEFLSISSIPGALVTVKLNATSGNVNETWTAGATEVCIIRSDASRYTAIATLPNGYTLAGSGATTYALTARGETVRLLLNGTLYYEA